MRYLKTQSNPSIGEGTPNDPLLIELMDAASLDKSYYDKITASVGPILAEITQSHASQLLMSRQGQPEIELMSLIKEKKILYLGLDSLTNLAIAQAVGKAFLSDLVSTAGKLYKQASKGNRINIHCDELAEILQDSFVKILNKAGGAGFQVTAYAQTLQDLEVALESRAKAEMTVGNLNTLIMLRVQTEETAKLLTTRLPQVTVVDQTQVSTVHDKPIATEGELFTTTNEDRLQTSTVPMLEVKDLISLPKGQAFVLMNGGELYKLRIPLPLNDGLAPNNLQAAIRAINQLES